MIATWSPPELPWLKTLLDPVAIGRILAAGPLAGDQIETCWLERVRYRPGRNCLLTWRIGVVTAGRADSASTAHRFSLLACRDGASAVVYAESMRRAESVQTSDGRDLWHLAEFDAVLWAFPNERKLRGITRLNEPGPLLDELAELIPGSHRGSLAIVQYVAERSCTVRLTAAEGALVAYGKFYRPGEAERAWRTISALWESRARRNGHLTIPEPLAWHAGSDSVWLRELPGHPPGPGVTAGELKATGQALAALHLTVIEPSPPDAHDPVTRLEETIPVLVEVRPDLASRFMRLAIRLGESTPYATAVRATLHGDLHLKNILGLADGRIGLIDLDNLMVGDPLLDLGSLAAYLHYRGMVEGRSPAEITREIGSICEGYEAEGGWPIDRVLLRHRIAAALISERAWRIVTRLKPDGPTDIGRLLELAEALVEE